MASLHLGDGYPEDRADHVCDGGSASSDQEHAEGTDQRWTFGEVQADPSDGCKRCERQDRTEQQSAGCGYGEKRQQWHGCAESERAEGSWCRSPG